MVKCRDCGNVIEDSGDDSQDPYRDCGSFRRTIELNVTMGLRLSDRIQMETCTAEGRVVGFRESEHEGRAAAADDAGGIVSSRYTGSPPRGEEDTLGVCKRLVQALNARADNWETPCIPSQEHGVDCISTWSRDEKRTLQIQVVRACVDHERWRKLGAIRHSERSNSAEQLADMLRAAIELKRSAIPPSQLGEIVLALDATRTPELAFDSVVEAFRRRSVTVTHGFRSVWVVGPTSGLIKRLTLD